MRRLQNRSRRLLSLRAGVLLGFLLLMPILAVAQTGGATDPAYVNGYTTGYTSGQQDNQNGAAANAHKFKAYQDGSQGYTEDYGTQAAYRTAFQSGFDDGYADGYNGRPQSVGAGAPQSAAQPQSSDQSPAQTQAQTPLQANAPPPAGADVAAIARGNGYREGYTEGQADGNRRFSYNATGSSAYEQAVIGYNSSMGDSGAYQQAFRGGFTAGYDDGYYHRLYNTSIGPRTPGMPTQPDNAAGGGTGNLLPTDPEVAKARPSGVYDNGILIAEGTAVQATFNTDISTKTAKVGDLFTLTVTVPVWVGATEAVPAGTLIHGEVKTVTSASKMKGNAQLLLQYDTIEVPGRPPTTLAASTSSVGAASQSVNGEGGAVNGPSANGGKRIGVDSGVGAVLGGVLGAGIIRGAIAGATIGTAGVLMSNKKDLILRHGEPVTVKLDLPLELVTSTPPSR